MQNWKKSLSFHGSLPNGVANFECLLLNLHTLKYHNSCDRNKIFLKKFINFLVMVDFLRLPGVGSWTRLVQPSTSKLTIENGCNSMGHTVDCYFFRDNGIKSSGYRLVKVCNKIWSLIRGKLQSCAKVLDFLGFSIPNWNFKGGVYRQKRWRIAESS